MLIYVITHEYKCGDNIVDDVKAIDDKKAAQYTFTMLVDKQKKECQKKGFNNISVDIPNQFKADIDGDKDKGYVSMRLRQCELKEC